MKKTIGILGGMGPLATADLFRKITLFTKAGCDNDHIRVYIDSNAQIPDRTAAILNGGKDPLPEMRSALHSLEACGASSRSRFACLTEGEDCSPSMDTAISRWFSGLIYDSSTAGIKPMLFASTFSRSSGTRWLRRT